MRNIRSLLSGSGAVVGGEAGEGEENCPARAGAGPGKKSAQVEDVFKCRHFILEDFSDLELFLLGEKHDRQPGGGYEARNQV
jgi:hypothetical protein